MFWFLDHYTLIINTCINLKKKFEDCNWAHETLYMQIIQNKWFNLVLDDKHRLFVSLYYVHQNNCFTSETFDSWFHYTLNECSFLFIGNMFQVHFGCFINNRMVQRAFYAKFVYSFIQLYFTRVTHPGERWLLGALFHVKMEVHSIDHTDDMKLTLNFIVHFVIMWVEHLYSVSVQSFVFQFADL